MRRRRAILRATVNWALPSLLVALGWSNNGFAAQRVAVGRASDPVTKLAPVSYTAQDGHTETLVPWQGKYVSVLVEEGRTRDPAVMTRLVDALDRAWSYYASTVGQLPASDRFMLNGRDEIAEVSSTNPPNSCGGAACSYIGADGTEILMRYFEYGYQQIAQNDLYDQPLFYELGRNFFFWDSQLAFKRPDQDPVVTGFAVLMRFESMAAAGVSGAPYNGTTPFEDFKGGVEALAGDYEADPSLTFAGTLAQDKSPDGYGGTDFWASLMMQLAQRHGGQMFFIRFFHRAGSQPTASSTASAVTNWLRVANYAACTDLSPVFYRRWGFPRPDGTISERAPAAAVPEPRGNCVPARVYVSVNAGGRMLKIKPTRIHLLSNENLVGLRWGSWGGKTAKATGTDHGNLPSRRHKASNPVRVRATGRRRCGSRLVYTTILLHFTKGVPYAGQSHNTRFAYGCPR